ncbi:MAG: oprF [Chloroflexi bacterium]|nr:oprF [Chloroflexota bacterium]
MSIKDDSYDMLDLGPEKSKKPRFLFIGLILLLAAAGASAYAWQQWLAHAPTPAPIPISNSVAPVTPAVSPPAPVPVPTKKVPTPVNIVINFDSDSADITPTQLTKLQSLAKLINDVPGTMQVSAYTDDLGSEDLAKALSEQRAVNVVQTLKKLGASQDIKYNLGWYGELYPVADNATEQGRALNRRVEIYFSPTL